MSGKGGGKRKSEDAEDAVAAEGEVKVKKPAVKKAKAADKPPPKQKVIKLKPFTEIEERVAKGASKERNEAIAVFLDGIREAYKSGAEYMKAAAAAKAVAAVRAHDKPLRVAQELGALQGCGPSTVQKVYDFLLTYGEAPQGLAAQAAAAQADAGRDPDFSWLEDSERDVLVELLKKGEVPWEKVKPWRADIGEADFK